MADAAALDGVLAQRLPDLIVLDWMLPARNGPSAASLRANPRTQAVPVLMLTARSDDFDRVFGLEVGADDYLTKPFLPRELEARIKAILRHTRGPGAQPSLAPRRWRIGRIEFDSVARTIVLPDDTPPLPLTGSEFALLSLFVQHPNRVLTRDYLMRATRGRGADVFDRAIDIAVSRLRAKLEVDPQAPRAIRSVRGQGYVLTAPVEAIE